VGVFRGSFVPVVFAGVTLMPASGSGAPAVPAPATAAPAATPSGPAVLVDRIAAVVGDEIVLESEVQKLVAVRFLERRAGETDAAYRDRVLDERIVDLLRERQLRRTSGFEPKPEEVEARVAVLEARLAKERGVPAAAALAAAGTTHEELAAWVRRGLALDSYVRERLAPGLKLTEAELRAYYQSTFREAAKKKGLADVPPFEDVREEIREVVRELKLNVEIERWTAQLRGETRVLIYRR
jgi:peptidyl-prolyl cis-trans isomerase SurA